MAELKKKGADSVFRYKYKTTLYDKETGEEINLLDHLTRFGTIDTIALAGGDEKTEVRIVAAPVTEETANIRRMKAKKETRHKNPSKELLKLMSWTIYLTTLTQPEITFDIINRLYGLRWIIENIIKTWKSNFRFERIHNVSAHQLHVLLRARLIMITFLMQRLFKPLSERVQKTTNKTLSMMKLMRYIQKNKSAIYRLNDADMISEKTMEAILRYCTYDQRKRQNFETQKMLLFNEISSKIS
jgi:hypothetical protein